MSEVDRLSNPGLFPVLPVGDKQRDRSDSKGKRPADPDSGGSVADDRSTTDVPHPPKSIIDEYA